ncbi:MAG: hypothetical protein CSA61_01200 [Neptuniibacter caesariensis]|uniref:Agglutinin biogenesis protein MshI n=1 Tax=Neptuniibacter caesariensis TaxID=207954 RepID=A0A2G6JAU3_NEPCE|nr:MAG: hypothetical protein CSA61_01200 [Neptuniibacter caesariensis]
MFRKKAATKVLTSVVLTGEGVAFAHVKHATLQPEVTACLHISSNSPLKETRKIAEFVDHNGLAGTRAVVLLPDDSYQVVLVEKPDVPDEELTEALRWRLKDMVSFDVENVVIDYIELPGDAYRGHSDMVYAVVAQKDKVDKLTEWCEDIGLIPWIVDVPELALLNLVEDLADSEAGLAVFYIGHNSSFINLLSDQALYFTRNLTYHRNSSTEGASAAVLELQRSLDYYESQVGKPSCVRLVVMPLYDDDAPLMNELRYNLPLDLHSFSLANLIESSVELDAELQKHTTLAIAAALRTGSWEKEGAQ